MEKTGKYIIETIKRAASGYRGYKNFPMDCLPTVEQADKWVLSRTSYSKMSGKWTIARIEDCENARSGYPAYADNNYSFKFSKYFHPSKRDLITICEIIRRG